MTTLENLIGRFHSKFEGAPQVYRAPGRINIIGEHTDYNQGFVMPAAIGLYCWVAAAPRSDRRLVFQSEAFAKAYEIDLNAGLPLATGNWSDYPVGVAAMLLKSGVQLAGANLLIASDVPLGAGLSSSAALEVATAVALLGISGHTMSPLALAQLCQRAENEYDGARCGIMDQFIGVHGAAQHALLVDCRSLDSWPVHLPQTVELVICNTMVRHALAAGEYNSRRAECEQAVQLLAKAMPKLRSLRDVNALQLESHRNLLSEVVYRRCRHVVSENDRTQRAAAASNSGNWEELGCLMSESHRSLKEDYQVSCPELDAMVEIANQQPGIYGARMTGGGFGGCTINLVDAERVEAFQQTVTQRYQAATGLIPAIYVCAASDGAIALNPGQVNFKGSQ